jgi:hypothetical protein
MGRPSIWQNVSCAIGTPAPRVGDMKRRLLPLVALAVAAAWSGPIYALDVVAIEEHWEMTVGEPDASSSGPQVCMVTTPSGHLDGNFFMFTINHRSHPEYAPGGMQVQQWCGEQLLDSRSAPTDEPLHHDEEVLRWVQRTEVHGGVLTFEIIHGASSSWGDFGDDGRLKLTVSTGLSTLNSYRPGTPIEESGVSFAGNRVRSLVLTKLRWWDSEGNVYEMNAPIDIDADLDP